MHSGRRISHLPWAVIVPTALLLAIGLAGIARCDAMAETGGRFFSRQLVWVALASLTMVAIAVPPYQVVSRHGYWLYAVSIVLLVAVYQFPAVNGARRWIRIGPLGIQPSEFSKIAYIVALSRYLQDRDHVRRVCGVFMPAVLTLIPVVLILREPDLGAAIVFLPVLVLMLFSAGVPRRSLAALVGVGLLAMPVLWVQMSAEQRSRVTALFDQAGPGESAIGDGYQLRQAKQMIALGRVWGSFWLGPAVDDPAAYRLPEGQSDFIFCVIGERYGLAGLALVLGLYGWLVWRAARAGLATLDPFGRMLCFGVGALLGVQVLVNAGMSIGLLPVTGLSLPLVSYGGSGIVSQALAIGLLVNVALRPGYEIAHEPFCYARAKRRAWLTGFFRRRAAT